MKRKIQNLKYTILYVVKILKMPADTVFEIDYTKPTRRRVNRFVYIYHTVGILLGM